MFVSKLARLGCVGFLINMAAPMEFLKSPFARMRKRGYFFLVSSLHQRDASYVHAIPGMPMIIVVLVVEGGKAL